MATTVLGLDRNGALASMGAMKVKPPTVRASSMDGRRMRGQGAGTDRLKSSRSPPTAQRVTVSLGDGLPSN